MESIQYKQNFKTKTGLAIASAYLGTLLFIIFVTIGQDQAADFVNSFTHSFSPKSAGLFFGLIGLGPLFIILSWLATKIKIEFQNDALIVFEKSNPPITIHIKDIAYMIQDKPKPGQLNLYNANDTLIYSFHPLFKGNIILPQLIKFITENKKFKVEEMSYKAAFGIRIKAKKFIT